MHFVSQASATSVKRRVSSWVAALAVCTAAMTFLPSCKKDEAESNKAAADKNAADKEAAAKASADKAASDKAAAEKAAGKASTADKTADVRAAAAKASADKAAADKAAADKAEAEKAAADKAAADKKAADKAAADKAAAGKTTSSAPTPYDTWAKLKPGSSVTLKTTTEAAGNKSETQTTTVLKEVAPDKVVVETSTAISGVPGPGTPFKMEIPKATATATNVGTPAVTPNPNMKQSDETISVGGKEYKCHVVEFTTDIGGNKTTTKSWTCPDVPNMLVKSQSTTEGQFPVKSTMELVKIDVK